MKIAFATTFDGQDVRNWSGTPFHMSTAFANQGNEVNYIGNLKRKTELFFKVKQKWKKITSGQRESKRFNIHTALEYSKQVEKRLNDFSYDVILSPQINPVAYLNSNKPLVLWTDALYASLIGFYPGFSSHSASSIEQGNIITKECLSRCHFAIFSSDWAARTALEIYGIHKDKVKVVPFGANLENPPTLATIKEMLAHRKRDTIQLLFIGKQWGRKGGQVVVDVAKMLHASGYPVILHIVGCIPPKSIEIPSYIKVHGFIAKNTEAGIHKIKQLLRESHFLFVPSRAEAYGIVFCEANAYGLPCITTHVGGISTIVKDNINGMTFGLNASIESFCNYIVNAMDHYDTLALSSFHEFESRLNWKVASSKVLDLLTTWPRAL